MKNDACIPYIMFYILYNHLIKNLVNISSKSSEFVLLQSLWLITPMIYFLEFIIVLCRSTSLTWSDSVLNGGGSQSVTSHKVCCSIQLEQSSTLPSTR